MSKNIEININTGSGYETLLPQTTFANLIDTLSLTSSKLTENLPLNRLAENVISIVKVEYTGSVRNILPSSTDWAHTDDVSWYQLVLFPGKDRLPDLIFLIDDDKMNYGIFTSSSTGTFLYNNAFGFKTTGSAATTYNMLSWKMVVRKKVRNYTTDPITTLTAPNNGMYYSVERGLMIGSDANRSSGMFLCTTSQDMICLGFYFS